MVPTLPELYGTRLIPVVSTLSRLWTRSIRDTLGALPFPTLEDFRKNSKRSLIPPSNLNNEYAVLLWIKTDSLSDFRKWFGDTDYRGSSFVWVPILGVQGPFSILLGPYFNARRSPIELGAVLKWQSICTFSSEQHPP